mmetsp:Transcript_10275/g.27963  ORF Transcript_10275/g.27963 Transcript_10275/m.27963 type:complete len:305 (+) Transcript_10275:528-1442(+)
MALVAVRIGSPKRRARRRTRKLQSAAGCMRRCVIARSNLRWESVPPRQRSAESFRPSSWRTAMTPSSPSPIQCCRLQRKAQKLRAMFTHIGEMYPDQASAILTSLYIDQRVVAALQEGGISQASSSPWSWTTSRSLSSAAPGLREDHAQRLCMCFIGQCRAAARLSRGGAAPGGKRKRAEAPSAEASVARSIIKPTGTALAASASVCRRPPSAATQGGSRCHASMTLVRWPCGWTCAQAHSAYEPLKATETDTAAHTPRVAPRVWPDASSSSLVNSRRRFALPSLLWPSGSLHVYLLNADLQLL